VQLYRRAAQAAERVHGKDHSTRQSALQYLSSVLQRQGRFAEAHAILTDLLESCRRSAGPDHVQTAAAEVELSGLLFNAGHHHEAEQLAAHAAEVFRTVEGATTINALWPLRHLMKCLYAQGKETEARAVAERLLAGRAERAQRDESVTVNAFYFARELLAVEPADLRDPRQAMEVLDAARGTVSDDDDDLNYLMALAYEQLGQPAPAIDLLQPLLERMPIETSVGRNQCEDALFRLWNAAGNTEAGIEVFRRTLALRESQIPSDDVDVAVARIRLGEALVRHGRFAEAAEALRGCDSVDTQLPTWRQAQCKGLHGAALVGIGNEEQGTRLLESACDDLNNDPYDPANVRSTVTDLRFGPLTARVPP